MIEELRAHGFDPGPHQHPRMAGVLAAIVVAPIAVFVFARCGVFSKIDDELAAGTVVLGLCAMGALYGQIFGRAANDRRGGWMFGMAFGFAVWTLASFALRATGNAFVGLAAMGFFGGMVIHGALIGLAFPSVHPFVKRPLRHVRWLK
jgi:hypothetical protein